MRSEAGVQLATMPKVFGAPSLDHSALPRLARSQPRSRQRTDRAPLRRTLSHGRDAQPRCGLVWLAPGLTPYGHPAKQRPVPNPSECPTAFVSTVRGCLGRGRPLQATRRRTRRRSLPVRWRRRSARYRAPGTPPRKRSIRWCRRCPTRSFGSCPPQYPNTTRGRHAGHLPPAIAASAKRCGPQRPFPLRVRLAGVSTGST
jgi:hypothetical protein